MESLPAVCANASLSTAGSPVNSQTPSSVFKSASGIPFFQCDILSPADASSFSPHSGMYLNFFVSAVSLIRFAHSKKASAKNGAPHSIVSSFSICAIVWSLCSTGTRAIKQVGNRLPAARPTGSVFKISFMVLFFVNMWLPLFIQWFVMSYMINCMAKEQKSQKTS